MNITTAIGVISALANGVDPRTGEVFDCDSPYQSSDVIRALFIAMRELERADKSERRNRRHRLPGNAGKPWTEEEDRLLLERWDQGNTIGTIAGMHDRTLAGVQARLERHGRVSGQGLRFGGVRGYGASKGPGESQKSTDVTAEDGKS